MDSFIKDPDAVLDYKIDWSTWLDDDSITLSEWASNSAEITIDDSENTDTESIVWLSGGLVGKTYVLTNHITTMYGREDDRSIKIKIENR